MTEPLTEQPLYVRRDPDGSEHDITSNIERMLNPQNKVLRWACTCGMSWEIPMPGFPGGQLTHDGRHRHAINGGTYCDGHLTATMVDFPIERYREQMEAMARG